MMKQMNNRIVRSLVPGMLALLSMVLPLKGNAALMTTYDPVRQTVAYALDYSFKNNDPGSYNTATTDLTKSVAQGLFDLGNHSYGSVDALATGELKPSIRATGDNFFGWSSSSQNGGEVKFTNDGLVPEGTFNVWDNEKMALTTTVKYALLELNGVSGHQEITEASVEDGSYTNKDATVVRSDDALLDYFIHPLTPAEKTATFTGVEDFLNEWSVTGLTYVLVKPTDVAPMPELQIEPGVSGDALDLVWHSVSGQAYRVDYSTNLTTWLPYETSCIATQSQTRISVSTTNHPHAFFQVLFE
jgi:hypothetical protein